MRAFESLTARIVLLLRGTGGAEIAVTDKQHPEKRPFKHTYEWHQQHQWERDLDTLIGALGAEEVENDETA